MISAYVRSLGRLVSNLQTGAGNEAVGASLAAVLRQLRPRAAELRVEGETLSLNGQEIAVDAAPEIATLHAAMVGHGVTGLDIQMGVTAREILQCTALLAVRDTSGDQPSIFDAVRQLGFWHLDVLGEDDTATHAAAAPLASPMPSLGSLDDAQRLAAEFTAELDRAVTNTDAAAVALVLRRTVHLESEALDASVATPSDDANLLAARWTAAFDDLCTPPALRLVASLVLTRTFPQRDVLAVLQRAGDAATSTLMQYLTASASLLHRRLLFDAIVMLRTGIPVLIAHLDHQLWFVVRNAASLLGAIGATSAEPALISALGHSDERVRTAVATALAQLGTPTARRALEATIRDSSTEVRRRVLRALLNGDGLSRSAAVLSEAVDLERDPEVQLEVILALRGLGTPHAVQQLVRMCSPNASAGKSFEVRRAAMDALVALRPSAAAPLLRIQSQDRDPVVRTYAQAMLELVSRAA